jgi:hypothetical protein
MGASDHKAGEEGLMTVHCPLGKRPPIKRVPLSTRLDRLSGKRICIIAIEPAAVPFTEEMEKLFSVRYAGVTFTCQTKAGTHFDPDPGMWARMKQESDGVIMAVGHTVTSASAIIKHCRALEELGVPAVPVVSGRYREVAETSVELSGVPMRIAFVPHPVWGQPPSVLQGFLTGNDPVTGKTVIDEIFEGLTKPLTVKEKKKGTLQRPVERLVGPDSPENLDRLFYENGWTDGLPIVLPTEKRVAAMLQGTSHGRDEVVGRMGPPPFEEWEYTVEQVAVNAVMAGARTADLPVILAIASTGLTSLFPSDSSFSRMVLVNGPVRKEIGMNCEIGAMGPFNKANATIGRAWTLISKNLGNSGKRGITYFGFAGNPTNYNNLCFGENEEALPSGWKQFHVQKGYKPEESTVSMFTGWSLVQGRISHTAGDGAEHQGMSQILGGLIPLWGAQGKALSGATIFASPGAAELLREKGFGRKEELSQWLYKNTLIKVGDFWKNFLVDIFDRPRARQGVEPLATYLVLPEENMVPRFSSPATINLIVVGGGPFHDWFAGDHRYLASASVDGWR